MRWLATTFLCLGIPALSGVAADSLTWQAIPEGRRATVAVPTSGRTGFTELDGTAVGIAFTNRLAEERYLTNQILLNGSGVAAGDVDGDGACDLYFCSLDGANALYRNLGHWRFRDITAEAGVACPGQASTGAALADIDGDGDLDLLVNGIGRGTRLFLNDGHGHFREETAAAGFRGGTGAHSLALADIDGDGDLDVYVANYRSTTFRDEAPKRFRVSMAGPEPELLTVDGRPVTDPDLAGRFTVHRTQGVLENGEADVLYRNLGGGRFEAANWTDRTFLDEDGKAAAAPHDWGLSAMFHDLNGDGAPDLYVCNDFQSPDRIWLNDGQGRFRAIAPLAIRQTSIFSMGVDIADVDRDGFFDLFVADMFSREHAKRQVQLMERQPGLVPPEMTASRPQSSRNTLLRNWGDATFAEIAQLAGVEASDWTWCPVFLDVDLDGFEDLLAVTGHVRDAQNIDIARQIDALARQKNLSWRDQLLERRRFQPLHTPNFAFRNRGDLTFEEQGEAWGFHSREVSQGIALADLDNDGDLDVVINCLNDSPLLCRNESPRPRLAVRLRGRGANPQGIGARITVRQAGLPAQSQEIISGGRYLSSDDTLRVFAVAGTTSVAEVEVAWRTGARTRLSNATANSLYELSEPALPKAPAPPPTAALPATYFADVSDRLQHRHRDEPFDDFARQPLLPRRLSQLGPGVSWFDLDGDGWEDLIVPTGRSGTLAVFRNDQRGGFVPLDDRPLRTPAARDQTTVLGAALAPGRAGLLVGSSNYEDGSTNGACLFTYGVGDTGGPTPLPLPAASVGPLALADLDGDGDLDLFVGARTRAGLYPDATNSHLLRNEGGQFVADVPNTAALAGIGAVSSATFTDLDGDGLPELVLACDGGPLRMFRNQRGRLSEWVPRIEVPREAGTQWLAGLSALDQLTGWWNSVAAGDFDEDGRLDLVAGNWGRNTRYERFRAHPVRLYAGDLDGDGSGEVVETYFAPELNHWVPFRDWETLATTLPFLRERYHNFTAFSEASVEEILGERLTRLRLTELRTFESVLLLNRGEYFIMRPLPLEAQFSPVFGIAVADFDNDGHEDTFPAQNFFSPAPPASRHDAGLGVWLRGDGAGNLIAVPPTKSGLRVYGEGRGAAAGDFDQDGRVDLVVGQNRESTRLFRNIAATPGLRVSVTGPPGNPTGIGAVLRAMYADGRRGPARELSAGNGYWSQSSAVAVVGRALPVRALEVRWPGGRTSVVEVATAAATVRVPCPNQIAP